ncbi:tRNA1(Val) (adenine(37)-N6)-methyltransferase [Alteribacillus sp. JSM 102045]|uniref:tRNA1(Val) (adenine(37)-N6)-methyltransferase n=1 Tax=Alteribacillus sp. JSM 102045 TaxID=1562101 RepID=UPI0035C1B44D
MPPLLEGERIDYVTEGLEIIQSKDVFAFSIDAVLLAKFTYVPITKGSIIDLCSGNGIIPLVLSTRSSVPITGIEIQPRLVDMARRSVQYNHLDGRLTFIEGDIREKNIIEKAGKADLVTCNPPYFATPGKKQWNNNPYFTMARHERNGTLNDMTAAAASLVKQKGKVSMVLRPERLPELMEVYRKHDLEPKRLKFVHPKAGKEANIVLLEAIKGGKPGLTCLPSLIVYNEDGKYTEEFQDYYAGN